MRHLWVKLLLTLSLVTTMASEPSTFVYNGGDFTGPLRPDRTVSMGGFVSFSFYVEAEPIWRQVSNGSGTSYELRHDAVIERIEGVEAVTDFAVQAVMSPLNTYEETVSINSSTGRLSAPDVDGIMRFVSAGADTITGESDSWTATLPVQVQSVTSSDIEQFHSYATFSAPRAAVDNIRSRVLNASALDTISLYSTQDHANEDYVYNPDFYASDIDWSGYSPWNSRQPTRRGGVLLTPKHALVAAHYELFVGDTIRFVGQDGTVYTREVTDRRRHPNYSPVYPDLTVVQLNEDLPGTVSTFPVLPDDWLDYFSSTTAYGFRDVPAIRFNAAKQGMIGYVHTMAGSVVFRFPTEEIYQDYTGSLVTGDSGQPAFMLLNEGPVLLTVWTYGGAGRGTNIVPQRAVLQGLIDDMEGTTRNTAPMVLEYNGSPEPEWVTAPTGLTATGMANVAEVDTGGHRGVRTRPLFSANAGDVIKVSADFSNVNFVAGNTSLGLGLSGNGNALSNNVATIVDFGGAISETREDGTAGVVSGNGHAYVTYVLENDYPNATLSAGVDTANAFRGTFSFSNLRVTVNGRDVDEIRTADLSGYPKKYKTETVVAERSFGGALPSRSGDVELWQQQQFSSLDGVSSTTQTVGGVEHILLQTTSANHTIIPQTRGRLEYLIVGGGGAGGAGSRGGGGGAGEVLRGEHILTSTSPVTLGAGSGGIGNNTSTADGLPSHAFGMTALGGGAGGSSRVVYGTIDGRDGGSGGGGASLLSGQEERPTLGGLAVGEGEGNDGGAGNSQPSDSSRFAGGGGGASTPGGNDTRGGPSGDGGDGTWSTIFMQDQNTENVTGHGGVVVTDATPNGFSGVAYMNGFTDGSDQAGIATRPYLGSLTEEGDLIEVRFRVRDYEPLRHRPGSGIDPVALVASITTSANPAAGTRHEIVDWSGTPGQDITLNSNRLLIRGDGDVYILFRRGASSGNFRMGPGFSGDLNVNISRLSVRVIKAEDWFAAGGGGGGTTGSWGVGGKGGGGDGGAVNVDGSDATRWGSGGGGAGNWSTGGPYAGGDGADGVVFIRYPLEPELGAMRVKFAEGAASGPYWPIAPAGGWIVGKRYRWVIEVRAADGGDPIPITVRNSSSLNNWIDWIPSGSGASLIGYATAEWQEMALEFTVAVASGQGWIRAVNPASFGRTIDIRKSTLIQLDD